MKSLTAALAVLTSLTLAAPALAHNPEGIASQACAPEDRGVLLTASFTNPGFDGETTVTAIDSGGADLGEAQQAPGFFSASIEGTERAAGTVTFDWSADDGDSGSLEASYEAVSDCEGPPVVPPPDNPPPPENPPEDEVVSGGPDKPSPPDKPAASPPADTLPLTGAPVVPVLMVGLGLLGAGIAIRRLHRG